MVDGTIWTDLSTTDLIGFSCTVISRFSRVWSEKKRKYSVSSSNVYENVLLMSEVRGERAEWFEMIERQQ